jgi:hypothetical protein
MSNVLFPTTVVDDFFDNPHDVRKLALSTKFYPNKDGRWPGARSRGIHTIDKELFEHTAAKILSLFYNINDIENYTLQLTFQHITPSHEKNSPENRGFIHRDHVLMGGVIYLDEEYEEGIGTSIYTPKKSWYSTTGYNSLSSEVSDLKNKKYKEKQSLDSNEMEIWNKHRDRFNETITVQNLFNRCILFDGSSFHGVPHFGTKERLTMNIFFENIKFYTTPRTPTYPLYRSSFT